MSSPPPSAAASSKLKSIEASIEAETKVDALAKLFETLHRVKFQRDWDEPLLTSAAEDEARLEGKIECARAKAKERLQAPAREAAERAKKAAANERATVLFERYRNVGEPTIARIPALMASELHLAKAAAMLPVARLNSRPSCRGLMIAPNFCGRLRLPRLPFHATSWPRGLGPWVWSEYSTLDTIKFVDLYAGVDITPAALINGGDVQENIKRIEAQIYAAYEKMAKSTVAMLGEFAKDNAERVEGVDTASRRLSDPSYCISDKRPVNVASFFSLPHLSGPGMFWSADSESATADFGGSIGAPKMTTARRQLAGARGMQIGDCEASERSTPC